MGVQMEPAMSVRLLMGLGLLAIMVAGSQEDAWEEGVEAEFLDTPGRNGAETYLLPEMSGEEASTVNAGLDVDIRRRHSDNNVPQHQQAFNVGGDRLMSMQTTSWKA